MKKCTWCGADYSDNLTECPVDQHKLSSLEPIPLGQNPLGKRNSFLKSWRDGSPNQPFRRENVLLEISELFGRYIAGIAVAFVVVLICLFLMVAGFAASRHNEGFTVADLLLSLNSLFAGYAGILAGAVCLPVGTRAFGSLALWIIFSPLISIYFGLGLRPDRFYLHTKMEIIAPLIIGGALVVLFFNWRRWPRFVRR